MLKYLRNLKYILHHKYHVMRACWRMRFYCPSKFLLWRGLIHDISKFSPLEFKGYAKHFFSDEPSAILFADALEHHIEKNRHHLEHWEDPDDMTDLDLFEMVCDWYAAGISKKDGDPLIVWYKNHIGEFGFCEEQRNKVEYLCVLCDTVMNHRTEKIKGE